MSQARGLAVAIGVVATILLVWIVNPWVAVPDSLSGFVTGAFWILSIALVVVLYLDARRDPESGTVEIEGPAFTRFLFSNSRAGIVWLPIRLFLGFTWLEASDAAHNVLAFARLGEGDTLPLVCVLNLSPVPREDAVVLAPVKDKASGWRLRAIL